MHDGSIAMVSVPVSDPDRAKDWYTSVLGMAVESDEQMGPAMRWVMLRPSGGGAAITLTTWFETMAPGSRKGTVFAVPDIEVAAAHLVAVGALPEGEAIEDAPWGRWVTIEDPDGSGFVALPNANTGEIFSPLRRYFGATPKVFAKRSL